MDNKLKGRKNLIWHFVLSVCDNTFEDGDNDDYKDGNIKMSGKESEVKVLHRRISSKQ